MSILPNSIHIVIWRSTGLARCPPGWSLISSHALMMSCCITLHTHPATHTLAKQCSQPCAYTHVHPLVPTTTASYPPTSRVNPLHTASGLLQHLSPSPTAMRPPPLAPLWQPATSSAAQSSTHFTSSGPTSEQTMLRGSTELSTPFAVSCPSAPLLF